MAYRRRKKFGLFGRSKRRRRLLDDDLDLESGFGLNWQVSSETKKGILVIFLFLISSLSILALFDLAGEVGQFLVRSLAWLFGDLKWVFPAMTMLFTYFLARDDKYQIKIINYLGSIFLVLGLVSLWHLMRFDLPEAAEAAASGRGGGHLGLAVASPLFKAMGFWGAFSVCAAVFLIGLLLTFEISVYGLMWPIKLFSFLASQIKFFFIWLKDHWFNPETEPEEDDYEEEAAVETEDKSEIVNEAEKDEPAPGFKKTDVGSLAAAEAVEDFSRPKRFGRKIELPLSLLTGRSSKPTSGDIKNNQEIIRRTLANFGIPVEMGEVNIGPTVTQYTLRPADGVKLAKIVNLNSDLALALAAHPIRIEAPIPGRSLVGIEIPNQLAAVVTMNDLLVSKEFKSRLNNLTVALGKDVSGRPFFASLEKMPHLLIAGATGSGKSVCINSIIISLLYQNSPDDLKFILVDPKRVELPIYNGIPYLLTPVITDVKKTINALKWTVVEMERRFELLSKSGKRNIEIYNRESGDQLPYIIFIIDELADLMASAAADVEAGIIRLAQMARAVGIHLILATQRPSVEVITGLIKANIPARIAFAVASLIDSRTILDSAGAEKLVGRGDMLYLGPNISRPKRLQGVFLSDQEIKNVVRYIKNQGEAEYVEGVVDKQFGSVTAGGGFSDDGDPILGEAKEVIRESGKASASLLQRRLKIGYARAARILDLLEEQGIVGSADGAKPREVYLERLGEVDALTFAAREHDLTGELIPTDRKSAADWDESEAAGEMEEEFKEENNDQEEIGEVEETESAAETPLEDEQINQDSLTIKSKKKNIHGQNRQSVDQDQEEYDEGEWT